MSTAGAFIKMAAERGSATPRNWPQHFDVLPSDHVRLRSMKASPAARTRSATSSGSRLIYWSCGDSSFSLSESRGLAFAF